MAAPASLSGDCRAAGSCAGYRRLLAYKVLEFFPVNCKAAGSPFALFFGCQPYGVLWFSKILLAINIPPLRGYWL